MDPSEINLYTTDPGSCTLAAWLCLAAALLFAFRWPEANVLLGISLTGLAGAPLFAGLTYAKISIAVAVLTVLNLLWKPKRDGTLVLRSLRMSPLAWFAGVCLLILAKIAIECCLYGLDASRTGTLIRALVDDFSLVVLLLAATRMDSAHWEHGLIISMTVFPVLMVAGLLPFMLQNGLLTKYLVGAQRFTIGPIDFITSAAVLAYGLVGWMVLISLLRRRGRRAVALLVSPIPLGFIVLLLMNGTRQYALGAAVFLFLWGFVFERTTLARWLGSLVLLVGVVYAISALLASTDMQLKDRFSREQLRGEALEGRGLIWTKVVRTTLDHPVLGTGFRNYGENVVGMDKLRHPVVTRDVAHGVIQDVFVEHGLFLGTAFLAGCLHMLVRCWRGLRHERGITAGKGLRAGFMAMLVPLVFSGGFLNAAAVFLLLFLAMVDDRQALLEQLAGPRRSRTKVAGLVPCDEGNIGALTPRSGRGL